MPPRVEFLFWAGCPSHERALAELRTAMSETGLDPGAIEVTEILGDDDAERTRFTGSPTILVDGRDVAGETGEPVALACRVYHRRDGRVTALPDPDDVRDALRGAAAR
jgi:hypothetical protein